MERVEVCVVGGGVTGLAAAWRLGLRRSSRPCCSSGSRSTTTAGPRTARRGSSGSPTPTRSTSGWRKRRCRSGASSRRCPARSSCESPAGSTLGEPTVVEAVAVRAGVAAARRSTACSTPAARLPVAARGRPGDLLPPHRRARRGARAGGAPGRARERRGSRSAKTRRGLVSRSTSTASRSAPPPVTSVRGGASSPRERGRAPLSSRSGSRSPCPSRGSRSSTSAGRRLVPFIHYGDISRYAVPAFASAAGSSSPST